MLRLQLLQCSPESLDQANRRVEEAAPSCVDGVPSLLRCPGCSISLPGAWRLPKTSEAMISVLVVFLPFSQLGATLIVIHVTM
jgi:hypothetical protein